MPCRRFLKQYRKFGVQRTDANRLHRLAVDDGSLDTCATFRDNDRELGLELRRLAVHCVVMSKRQVVGLANILMILGHYRGPFSKALRMGKPLSECSAWPVSCRGSGPLVVAYCVFSPGSNLTLDHWSLKTLLLA